MLKMQIAFFFPAALLAAGYSAASTFLCLMLSTYRFVIL